MKDTVVEQEIDSLSDYLTLIVEPTFADFQRNPLSARHAFLACVAIFHSVDRAAHPKRPANLRKQWQKQSTDFLFVDMFAHRLKHVRSHYEKHHDPKKGGIPISRYVDTMRFHNLQNFMRDAITFVRKQAEAEPR